MTDPRQAQVRLAVLQSDLRRGPLSVEQQAELLDLAEGLRAALEEAGGWRVLGDRLVETLSRSATQAEQSEVYLQQLAASQVRWSQAALRASDWRVMVVALLLVGALLRVVVLAPVSLSGLWSAPVSVGAVPAGYPTAYPPGVEP